MGKEKIIALFNNKGGVSKTTTTYNLGWMLTELGNKVLMVDSDPQCNLTGLSINSIKEAKLDELYKSDVSTIKSALDPVFGGNLTPLLPAKCFKIPDNEKLFLLPGHIQFSEFDTTYNIAETMTGSLNLMKNVPGAFRKMIELTAAEYDIDYVLVDMSPSISATNANIFMQSDYFIVPCAPDYFCYMAVESLSAIFPRWCKVYDKMSENEIFQTAAYKLKKTPPIFLGTIQQRYRPRNGSPARAFAEWINDINDLVVSRLVPILKKNSMCVSEGKTYVFEEPYNLINIADFNSLIAHSQEFNVPIYLLKKDQVNQTGVVWKNLKKSRDDFYDTFSKLANKIMDITK